MKAANLCKILPLLLLANLQSDKAIAQGTPAYQLNLLPFPVKIDRAKDKQPAQRTVPIRPYAGNQALINVKPHFGGRSEKEEAAKSDSRSSHVLPGVPDSAKMIEILRGTSMRSQLSSNHVQPQVLDRVVRVNPRALPKGMDSQSQMRKSAETFRIQNGRTRVESYSGASNLGHTYPPGSYSRGNHEPTPSIVYRVDPNSRLSTNSVRFRQGSVELADHDSYLYLQNLALALRDPWLRNERFVIEGHASAEGSDASNMILSQRRANAIYDFLIEQGVDHRSIVAVGHGEYFAKHSARDPEYLRAQDRQVIVFKLAE